MGKVKVSVINERKMLDYYKDCCMAMETCYAEYQNQVKRRPLLLVIGFSFAYRFHEQY